jgi:hypothetical protein
MDYLLKKSEEIISLEEYCELIRNTLISHKLDVEVDLLIYEKYIYTFTSGKFEKDKSLVLPLINGIGEIPFDKCDFSPLNQIFFTKLSQKANFKVRYTKVEKTYIAGDFLNSLQTKPLFKSFKNESMSLNFSDTVYKSHMLIFSTLDFIKQNINLKDIIIKVESFSPLTKIYLILTDSSTINECYESSCENFLNKNGFKNITPLYFPYEETEYKKLNLSNKNFDNIMCYIVNNEGKLLLDFSEFNPELLNIIQSNQMESILEKKFKETKRYSYKTDIFEDSKFSLEEIKNFVSVINKFEHEKIFNKSDEKIIVTIQKKIDINMNHSQYHERIKNININYQVEKRNQIIFERFNNMLDQKLKNLIEYKGFINDYLQVLQDTLKGIEMYDPKILKNIQLEYFLDFDNGEVKKYYKLNNKNYDFNLHNLNQIENDFLKNDLIKLYFREFNLVPRLNQGDLIKDYSLYCDNILKWSSLYSQTENSNKKYKLLYFFTSWSKHAMDGLKIIAKFSNYYDISVICYDSCELETKANIYNLLHCEAENLPFEFMFIPKQEMFEILLKSYSAFKTNHSFFIINKKDNKIILRNNTIKSLSEYETILEMYKNEQQIKENLPVSNELPEKSVISNMNQSQKFNSISKNLKNNIITFYKGLKFEYKPNFEIKSKYYLSADSNDNITENLRFISIQTKLRIEDHQFLQDFLNSLNLPQNVEVKIQREILNTVNFNDFYTALNITNIECYNCHKIFDNFHPGVYYCHTCNNFTCPQCQPKHEHNLILSRFSNSRKEVFENIDYYRLGQNLAFYGNDKSKFHQAACNKCEELISNMARFICLNCLPGVPTKSGFNDYCEKCMMKILKKWETYDAGDAFNSIFCKEEHDEFNHLMLRLDFSVTYFDY